ncbi:MAG: response regulator transcription factor [Chloroflexi bacterium]|nr:response regulator transcription factor [Chloroflexota bacterium]
MAHRVLVVDDDVAVAETIQRTLTMAGHDAQVAYRGADALLAARQQRPEIVVLDIMMPGMSGIEVCRHMRANPELCSVPILFLTARGEIADKIEGFEAGADDYLTKPFDLRELDLRVKALLRRSLAADDAPYADRIELGDLTLNRGTYELTTCDRTVLLTPVEYELFEFLMTHPNKVFSADQLLQEVWEYPPGTGMPDLVRVHVKNIRDKVEPEPRNPIYVRNVLRRGYMVVGTADQ